MKAMALAMVMAMEWIVMSKRGLNVAINFGRNYD